MARGGFKLNATYHFKNCPNLDVLIIVGGIHTDELKKDKVIDWIKETSKNAKLIASVCTGAFFISKSKCYYKSPSYNSLGRYR